MMPRLALALLTFGIVGSAAAQGIPERVTALETAVGIHQTRIAALETRAASQETTIANLQTQLKALDEGSGLVRTVRETHTVAGTAFSPAARQFPGRQLLAVAIVPNGAGTPGHPPFVVLPGTSVSYAGCGSFAVQSNTLSGQAGACPTNVFDVLYVYAGPRL